jgi:glycosyltransferase involved in cell wall biosynthesis
MSQGTRIANGAYPRSLGRLDLVLLGGGGRISGWTYNFKRAKDAPGDVIPGLFSQTLENAGLRVGYVGVMGSQDGIEHLVDAWQIVTAEPDLADATLELVGDGEARPQLERQVQALGLGDRVRFHGYLPATEFVPILAACRLTVSPDPPTPFNDVSTMVKVLDSLVIGRPVVAFDLQESRRLIGDAGVIVDEPAAAALARAIVALLREPAETDRLAERAARRPEELGMGWDHSAAALRAAYDRLRPGSSTTR